MKRFRTGEEGGDMEINMAHVLMLLSQAQGGGGGGAADNMGQPSGRVFECKTCNRQFPSFQALGGHRASHKKPRLLDDPQNGQARMSKPRVHECSICGLEFSLGQALGGHMRRHRVTADVNYSHVDGHREEEVEKKKGGDGKRVLAALDLNLTPMENDAAEIRLLTFSLGPPMVH